MKTFKTNKGTELPILNMKGKDYLQVAQRLVWFREEKPEYHISTEPVQLTDTYSVFKATICDLNGRILATGHKREDKAHFTDFMEKSETGAIGRALACLGYGTQFAPEIDEGERIVDSPIEKVEHKSEGLFYVFPAAAKKYAGKKINEIPMNDLVSYYHHMNDWYLKENKEPRGVWKEILDNIKFYAKI